MSRASPLLWTFLVAGTSHATGWGPGLPIQTTRYAHAMAFDDARDHVLMFGGWTDATAPVAETWVHDGTRWTATATPASMPGRADHAMAYDSARGVVVLFGGSSATSALADTWEHDGVRWRQGPAGPPALTARYFHAMAFDAARGEVVLFGGNNPAPNDDTWTYDGAAWTAGPAAPASMTARGLHAMAFHPTIGRVVLYGGETGAGFLSDTWLYDGFTWSQGPPAPVGLGQRSGHAMAYDTGRGAVVVFGGFRPPVPLADTWLFDGTVWSAGPTAPAGLAPRRRHAMAFDVPRQRTVLFGGQDAVYFRDTWELDAIGWQAGAPAVGPLPRSGHAAAFDAARGRVVAHGGFTAAGISNEVWEYDGASWSTAPSPPTAPGRFRHAMAFDAARGLVVFFGGGTTVTDFRNDTWEYDGTTWTPGAAPGPGMLARSDHAMVWDSGRNRLVLFGGRDGSGTFDDTWEHDGSAWIAGPVAPGGLVRRREHAMAFDSVRDTTVLFGGLNSAGTRLRDTWEYDGTSWTAGPAAPPALTARYGHAMAFDPESAVTILFGGNAAGFASDTWLFDGASWLPATATGPSEREGHTLAFDTQRGRAVLISGFDGAYIPDSWEYGAVESYVTGEGLGQTNGNRIRTWDGSASMTGEAAAYGAGAWGTNVAGGDIDGGAEEILSGPGPGDVYGPQVRAFRGDLTAVAKINFYAYGTLRYGVNPGSGRIDGDAFAEILTGPGPGAVFGPHVRGFNYDGQSLTAIAKVSFFAYGTLKYGVNHSSADLERDAFHEILTAPGPGAIFRPQVRAFDYDGSTVTSISKINFDAFGVLQYGANVAGGDVDRDGYGEITAAPGPGPTAAFPAEFRGFDYDGSAVAALPGYLVSPFPGRMFGGRVGLGDLWGAAAEELLAGAGRDPSADSTVRTYRYDGASLAAVGAGFVAFAGDVYGVNVTGATIGP